MTDSEVTEVGRFRGDGTPPAPAEDLTTIVVPDISFELSEAILLFLYYCKYLCRRRVGKKNLVLHKMGFLTSSNTQIFKFIAPSVVTCLIKLVKKSDIITAVLSIE